MRRAAIVAPVRTAVGTFGGSLWPLRAEDLAAKVVEATVARSGVDPGRIEDVVFAQSYANSEAPCIGRWVALHANLPVEIPGIQIDRRCGGGPQAVITAAMTVQTGPPTSYRHHPRRVCLTGGGSQRLAGVRGDETGDAAHRCLGFGRFGYPPLPQMHTAVVYLEFDVDTGCVGLRGKPGGVTQ